MNLTKKLIYALTGFILVWCVFAVPNIHAQNLPTGPKDLYDYSLLNKSPENRELVVNALNKLVAANNKPAMYYLARIYYETARLKEDYELAYYNILKAIDGIGPAEKGIAYYILANMFLEGNGTQKNVNSAIENFEKAANFGNFKATTDLARIYLEGKLLPKNTETALKLLQTAAANNNSDAAYELAQMYKKGIGVSVNFKLSNEYLKTAAQGDNVIAKIEYGMALYDETKENCVFDDLKKYFEPGTIIQNDDSLFYMAKIILECDNPRGKPDVPRAINYLKLLAKKNVVKAQIELSRVLIEGSKNVPAVNPSEGIRTLTLYADSGLGQAALLLAKFKFAGIYVQKNREEAFALGLDALKNNTPDAVEFMFKYLEGVVNDKKAFGDAVAQLSKLAESQNFFASYIMGKLYSDGTLVPINLQFAGKFLTIAVKNQFETYLMARKLFARLLTAESPIKNLELAYKILSVKGIENDSEALFLYGKILANPQFPQFDIAKGIKVYQLAADNGNPDAIDTLATIYLEGVNGAGKDEERALSLLEKSSQTQVKAAITLAKLYWNGFGKIARNQNRAIEVLKPWQKKLDPFVNMQMAIFYMERPDLFKGVSINPVQSFKVLADTGIKEAQYQLGLLFLNEDVVAKSVPDAEYYLNLAAKNNMPEARTALAVINLSSDNKQQQALAVNALEAKVNEGDIFIIYNLALYHFNSENFEKGFVFANLYRKLVPAGNANRDAKIDNVIAVTSNLVKDKTKAQRILEILYNQIVNNPNRKI